MPATRFDRNHHAKFQLLQERGATRLTVDEGRTQAKPVNATPSRSGHWAPTLVGQPSHSWDHLPEHLMGTFSLFRLA